MEADASQWVINSPELAPAFILARNGYDIWMGNNRGNVYSVAHENLDPDDEKDMPIFYNFDFEDMGMKDLPAEIDFILEKTG